MSAFWERLKKGYLSLFDPLADALVARRVHPNVITTVGLVSTLVAAGFFASGHISIGGWVLGLTAIFDALDGTVARRTGQASVFGAFYDSTLDRIADGAALGGLAIFWAANTPRHSLWMVGVCLFAIIGAYLTSYTRARAEGLGLDARVGLVQRAERVVLLSVPQAFFGLAFDGLVLKFIVVLLAITSWITVAQRMLYVRRATATLSQTSSK
ncbi:MAG: CDP-alcohol phosphatidyltransferase family protein [Gemmatimonadetes bacterium]|nr:CDP-alcohol phosphatidyltransferase family protein [Gemmatimonadota bacterium]